jgi:hypothetical protein
VGSAIIRAVQAPAFDISIVELAHRGRTHQTIKRGGRWLAVMIVGAEQADNHIALGFVVTDPLNEATAVDVIALKGLEIDAATFRSTASE